MSNLSKNYLYFNGAKNVEVILLQKTLKNNKKIKMEKKKKKRKNKKKTFNNNAMKVAYKNTSNIALTLDILIKIIINKLKALYNNIKRK